MKIPHPIPYQGSKRNLAEQILAYFPSFSGRFIEPFAGSAALSIATAYHGRSKRFLLNDINQPLIQLWKSILFYPEEIAERYKTVWMAQENREEAYYYEIRTLFNRTQRPEYLLYLLARCVKAAVRYNSNGEFNQSPDKRRRGRTPSNMREDILRTSELLSGKTELLSMNYFDLLEKIGKEDLVYLDPPYQGTGVNGGFRYAEDISHDKFVEFLHLLTQRQIPFILSYDGRTGNRNFGKPLPANLHLRKIELDAGRSSIATLLNRIENTVESLYLSENLVNLLDSTARQNHLRHQLALFEF